MSTTMTVTPTAAAASLWVPETMSWLVRRHFGHPRAQADDGLPAGTVDREPPACRVSRWGMWT